ncbi:unnamed protein product [Symbiodinium sp. CCMP2456]|nr:unnamed protein product [Symbiodinium sp. CCMP2456]
MPVAHRLLLHSSDEEVEKIQTSFRDALTTIGVVAALLLTMEKTTEVIDQEMDASEYIDCGKIPCNIIHLTLSWLSLVGCAHAVMYTTCAVVWMSLIPTKATKDFFFFFPNILVHPTRSMMMGVLCWSLDALWLAIINHGWSLMIWLSLPAFLLLFHVGYMFAEMRYFAWGWPNAPYGDYYRLHADHFQTCDHLGEPFKHSEVASESE